MHTTGLQVVVAMTTSVVAGGFVQRQLDSIAAQSLLPSAVFISNDASTDETRAIVASFSATAPFPVEVTWHNERVGLHRNFENALMGAVQHADVVVLADHDDVWQPGKLARIAEVFESDDDVAMWCSDATLIDEDDRPLGKSLWEMVHLDADFLDAVAGGGGLARLVHGQTFTGPTMAVRANVVERALPLPPDRFDDEVLFQPDGWLAVLARLSGDLVVDTHPFTSYRRHASQMTATTLGDQPAQQDRARDLGVHQSRVRLIADRVRTRDGWRGTELRDELFALDEFLSVRAMPRGAPGRRRRILEQGRKGAYRRFASGSRTMAYDLAG